MKEFIQPRRSYFEERNLLINALKSIGNTKLYFSKNLIYEILEKIKNGSLKLKNILIVS